MRIDQVAGAVAEQLIGRMVRRLVLAVAVGFFLLVALYHFTVAGTIALEQQYGALYAQLIVGAIYVAVAAVCIIWRFTLARASSAPALAQQRELQLVMLVEAAMLGYTLARKGERAS